MKLAKRRIDVNLEELDRVLDGARQAPLSEPDYDKLKDALHAMAALLARSRNTEKTDAVVGDAAGAEASEGGESDATTAPPAGHGRNRATAFTGARTVKIPHQSLKHGERCPECGQGKVYAQKEPRVLVRIVAGAAGSDGVFAGPVAVRSLRAGVHRRGAGRSGAGEVR